MPQRQREDYLMRQAKAIAAMLANIVGLRSSGATEEARAETRRATAELLGDDGELIERVDPATAATLLGSAQRIFDYARLLDLEAEQEPDVERASRLRSRARTLASEAARRDPGNEAIRAFLASPG